MNVAVDKASGGGTLRRNVVFLAASNLLAPLFSLVLVLAISRLRGVEELGKYSLVMTVFVLGQSCAGFGLPLVITREVAQQREAAGRFFVNACTVTSALLLPMLAVALATLAHTMADAELAWAIGLVLVALLITSVNAYGESILLAFEHAGDFVTINMGETILRAIAGVALVLSGHGVAAVAAGLLFFRVAAAATYVVVMRRRGIRFAFRIDRSLCANLLRHMPVVGLIPVVNAVYARADVFLLTSLASWADVGLYSAAMRFIELARTLPPAYARALYPVLARLRTASETEYRALVQRSLRTNLLITAPIVLGLFGVGGRVLTLLYGPQMAAAVPSLRILTWTLLPLSIAIMLAQVLFSANRQAIDLRVNLIAAVASVGLGAFLIPRFGAAGAATSTLASATLYAFLQYWWTRKYVADPHGVGDIAKIGIAMAGSCLIMAATASQNVWLATILGLACYGAALFALGVVERSDLMRFRLFAVSVGGRSR